MFQMFREGNLWSFVNEGEVLETMKYERNEEASTRFNFFLNVYSLQGIRLTQGKVLLRMNVGVGRRNSIQIVRIWTIRNG